MQTMLLPEQVTEAGWLMRPRDSRLVVVMGQDFVSPDVSECDRVRSARANS
jgi:hypothetical protein